MNRYISKGGGGGRGSFRALLHGVGDSGLVGLVSLFSRSGGHKTKETYPTRPGSPTPCKQGLSVNYYC